MTGLIVMGVAVASTYAGGIAGPVSQSDRITELDMLRGFALLGVLLMNFIGITRGGGMFATAEQTASLATAPVDDPLNIVLLVLFMDKANTLFATLFGLGFYLQMKRGEGIPGFAARYRRRLFWLMVFGFINLNLIWIWDILFVYALTGFVFLLMRGWRTRSLVVFGLLAALYRDAIQGIILGALGLKYDYSWLKTDALRLERQEIMQSGSYFDNVAMMAQVNWHEFLISGMLLSWIIYALGRFALGAAIGRTGILDDVAGHLPVLRKVAAWAIPAGLVLCSLEVALMFGVFGESAEIWGELIAPGAALVMAAGYASGLTVLWHSPWARRGLSVFVPVGQMALTNYLSQALVYGFVLFGLGIGPIHGLAQIGQIGTTAVFAICLVFFALQIAFSHWWLARYRFGPMEWLWRTLTYGRRPLMRRGVMEPLPA